MKEIGETLKEAREKNGVTAAEAATDLNLRVNQIEFMEKGEFKAFKDVSYLKQLIGEYSKYLGLDADKILENFNEFIFDYTSRIPLEKSSKTKDKKEKPIKKVASPYTNFSANFDITPKVIYFVAGILVLVMAYILYITFWQDKNEIKMLGEKGEYYEFS